MRKVSPKVHLESLMINLVKCLQYFFYFITAAGPGLTAALGALMLGSILDLFGRKTTLILCALFHAVGWTIIALCQNFLISFFGRMLTGLPATFICYAAQVYIVECLTVNDEHLRDTLRTWPSIGFAFGQLLTFLLGAAITHLQFSAFSAILSSVLIILMLLFVIESPGWLYQKGRIGDAEIATQKLRISQPILCNNFEPEVPPLVSSSGSDSSLSSILEKCRQQKVYKPALIMMVVCTLALFSGGMALNSYMVNIIDAVQPGQTTDSASSNSSASTNVSPEAFKYSIISGALMLLGTILLSFALPRLGARKLTITSAICMSVCMGLIGYTNSIPNPSDLLTVRLISVWAISFIYSFGIITVPFSILGEMFPLDAKGFASLAIVIQVLAAFAVSELYPYMYLWSPSGVFYIYGCMCVLYASFVYAFMPETVGRNYEEISADF